MNSTPVRRHTSKGGAPQREQLAALVGEVVDELRVLAVLARQRLAELKDRRVDRDGAVAREDRLDALERDAPDCHLHGQEVARALRDLGQPAAGLRVEDGAACARTSSFVSMTTAESCGPVQRSKRIHLHLDAGSVIGSSAARLRWPA
jgi:hypothetical protein